MSQQIRAVPIDGEFYAWVAPDGEIQLGFIAEEFAQLIALTQTFSSTGLVMSPTEMFGKGFDIEKVHLQMKGILNADDTFEAAKKEMK